MTTIASALAVMIVRVIDYVVQQNQKATLKQEQQNQYLNFIREVKHPAEHFLRQPRKYSYQDFIYYYRN